MSVRRACPAAAVLLGTAGGAPIRVYVDADACPVKDEVHLVAARHGWAVVLVANAHLHVPAPFRAELVRVGSGLDAADDWIAERAGEGDVVVTADIALAARCLERGARVLGCDGRPFTSDSIGSALAGRELAAFLRGAGEPTRGPRPFSDRDRSRFRAALDEWLRPRRAAPPGPRR
jgi:uncharacterized protein